MHHPGPRHGPEGRILRNRPDTDFGSGGHITQPWPRDPVDYNPVLRHGLKLACWNMDWFSDLFAEGEDAPGFKAEDMIVRGPPAANRPGAAPTVAHRLRLLRKAIIDLDPDIVIVLEGPNRPDQLEHFFSTLGEGEWRCHVQRSRYVSQPGGATLETQRCVGLAVRTDTSRFASDPFTVFDAEDEASGAIFDATEPFFSEPAGRVTTEWFRFETLPLYAEIRPQGGAPFRLLGVHIKSRGFLAGSDWTRWVIHAEANRARFAALANRLRQAFLDVYLADPATRDVPLLVAGGIDEGPGVEVRDPRGVLSAAEILMGSIWSPQLALGNALYDSARSGGAEDGRLADLWTMRFPDLISDRVRHKAWVDHVLYSRNAPPGWCAGASIPRATVGGIPFDAISDHFPVVVFIDTSVVGTPRSGRS